VATVNGSISIDDNAAVTSANTVNGKVQLGAHATAASLNSVNGSILLGTGAHVSGSASSVNGDLNLADGAEISGSLSNVNGKITLTGAHVGGGIKTVNGSMNIVGASHVEGGILVEKPSSQLMQVVQEVPRIVIGPGATVQGELQFERPVHLFVSDKATIGTVTGATPVTFTGETPPK
jgi:cytoskeletal protein CcmA (bactofilin family)